jgi:hypothetical protein
LDADPMNPIGAFRVARPTSLSNLRGRFNRFMVHARWSRAEDGFLRIYLNGRQVWSYAGLTTNAHDPIYFKYAIYRSFISRRGASCASLTAYYADVRLGSTRAEVE